MTSQWVRWRLKSPASRLFNQPFIQTQIKENIKAARHWPSCGTGEFPAQMASNEENVSIWWRHHGILQSVNFGAICANISTLNKHLLNRDGKQFACVPCHGFIDICPWNNGILRVQRTHLCQRTHLDKEHKSHAWTIMFIISVWAPGDPFNDRDYL